MKRRCSRLTAVLLVLPLALLMVGCAERGLDDAYTNYLQRLSKTLEVAAEGVTTTRAPRYPRTGKLQILLIGSSVDALDFMALTGCAVQSTIGKRNSSLGMFARPSQRLLLELEYLRLAPQCVHHLNKDGKENLATTLHQAWVAKQAQLPALIFNATLGGEEFRSLWGVDREPGHYPAVQSSTVITALGAINHHIGRWLTGDYQADSTEFELLLSEVAGGDGGVVLQALARQSDWLEQANRLLDARKRRGPLCAKAMRHAAADILPAVTQKFFVGEIQPQAANMERRMYALLPPIEVLEKTLADTLPANYVTWKTQRDALLTHVRQAPARHVAKIQQNLQGCDNSPQT